MVARTVLFTSAFFLLALSVLALPAHAGGVVSVCNEAHLREAMDGGGTVSFACSGTITLTDTITIADDTSIDGSGQVVIISGMSAVRILRVNPDKILDLNRITVANGYVTDGVGGGIYNDQGWLRVRNSTLSNNYAVGNGGAIFNTGTLSVNNSVFSDNFAGYMGGGIRNDGTVMVINSVFVENVAPLGSGLANEGGSVSVSNSAFTGNNTGGSFTRYDKGGSVYNGVGGTATIDNCVFSGNEMDFGGGIRNIQGIVTVSNSAFSGNGSASGGGIFNTGTLMVDTSTFSGNGGSRLGGGIYTEGGDEVHVTDCVFSDNDAGQGGAISNAGALVVNSSTFFGNRAWDAGGILNRNGRVTVSNSTIYENTAYNYGGGIGGHASEGALTVINSTISDNRALHGGGIQANGGTVTLQNTIVANNSEGGNCEGIVIDGGGNLSYPDTTCPGINSDPILGPLQNNGGPTYTMEPRTGSPAVDAADNAICAAAPVNGLDQRGVVRPQGLRCDIGGVERLPYRTWLPLATSQFPSRWPATLPQVD